MEWFAFRGLYLKTTLGKAKNKDDAYVKSTVMLEERVVLFKSKDINSAIKAGLKDAKNYSKYKFKNMYGEVLTIEFLDMWDTFELFENPDNGIEVFSVNDVYANRGSEVKAAKIKLGPKYIMSKENKLRKKFCPV